jgi:hypothetical protein
MGPIQTRKTQEPPTRMSGREVSHYQSSCWCQVEFSDEVFVVTSSIGPATCRVRAHFIGFLPQRKTLCS